MIHMDNGKNPENDFRKLNRVISGIRIGAALLGGAVTVGSVVLKRGPEVLKLITERKK